MDGDVVTERFTISQPDANPDMDTELHKQPDNQPQQDRDNDGFRNHNTDPFSNPDWQFYTNSQLVELGHLDKQPDEFLDSQPNFKFDAISLADFLSQPYEDPNIDIHFYE